MARPGLLLYFDILPALDKLPHAAVGKLLLAALHYAKDGVEPSFDDASLGFAWAFLRPAVDRDGITYETKQLKGTWLVYCKQCKRDDVQPLDFDTWRERTVDGALHTVDVSLPTTTTTPSPSPTTAPTQEQLQPIDGSAAAPPTPARNARGDYGWVKLTDEEFQRLEQQLGADELRRCVAYIDESAQQTGNKNGWKDWFVVIQRCHREGWGPPKAKPTATGGANFQPTADRIQKNNDWLDTFLAEQQKKEGGGKRYNLPGVTRL